MNVVIAGTGIVGLVTGLGLAELGHRVSCVDVDRRKTEELQNGKVAMYEPGVEDSLRKQLLSGNASFTCDLGAAMKGCDVVFICVGTPSDAQGRADIRYVLEAAENIGTYIEQYTVVASKSTVSVGTTRNIHAILCKHCSVDMFDVVSNPEFLREGNAMRDFHNPDRIVVGSNSKKARNYMEKLYRPLRAKILYTDIESAELIKYASNCFLATKLTFINQIADLCEKVGADIGDVAQGLGSDTRIGQSFLAVGPGYGGMCFPKDIRALQQIAEQAGTPHELVDAVIDINSRRSGQMVAKVEQILDGKVKGTKICVFGLSFKANTSDMRDAQSINIITALLEKGAELTVCDPQALSDARKIFGDSVQYQLDPYKASREAEVAVLITDWDQFKLLDLLRLKRTMRNAAFVDLRNCFSPDAMRAAGFRYISIGRKAVL